MCWFDNKFEQFLGIRWHLRLLDGTNIKQIIIQKQVLPEKN